MHIERVERKEYEILTNQNCDIFFDSAKFVELNREKVNEIFYLVAYKDKSPRCAFAFGVSEGKARAPFSAPFETPVFLKKKLSIEYYKKILDALEEYANKAVWQSVSFTLPPTFYKAHELKGWVNAFYNAGYELSNVDLNFALRLDDCYSDDYESKIAHNARKNLRISFCSGLDLKKCETEEEIEEAYSVISDNRQSKGYPLRMSLEQVLNTISIVGHDVFLVKHEGQSIAAALVYHVTADIAQVVYWGDRPGYVNYKPINFLSYQLIQYYGKLGFSYLDIGPSTENSIPNSGLCDFKESIGCERDLKLSFIKNFR